MLAGDRDRHLVEIRVGQNGPCRSEAAAGPSGDTHPVLVHVGIACRKLAPACEDVGQTIHLDAPDGCLDIGQAIIVPEHGIVFEGHEKLSKEVIAELEVLVPDGGRIKYIDTKVATEDYVYLGDEMKTRREVSESFNRAQDKLQAIYDVLLDYWDDLDWYEWFETEEALY